MHPFIWPPHSFLGGPHAGHWYLEGRETDVLSHPDTARLVSMARAWAVSGLHPRPDEPSLVCALGEWSTVLARGGVKQAGPAPGGRHGHRNRLERPGVQTIQYQLRPDLGGPGILLFLYRPSPMPCSGWMGWGQEG